MSENKRSMKELWRDYKFLSKELHKFTSADDIPLFEDLMNQRENLLSEIKSNSDEDNYVKSPQGQTLIKEVIALDNDLKQKMHTSRNMLKKSMEISSAYDGFVGENMLVGSRFDSKLQ